MKDNFILWFNEISIDDVSIVGGKNASLGEMYRHLTKRGVKIPNGFAITADAYRYLLEKDNLTKEISTTLKDLDINNLEQLAEKGSKIRKLIRSAEIPKDLEKQITDAYYTLSNKENVKEIDVAVRSSATAEDLPSISKDEFVYLKVNNRIVFDTIENVYNIYSDCKDIEVPSFVKNKIIWKKIDNIYKHPAKKKTLYKITTDSGKEIVVTKDHSLIALDSESFDIKTVCIDKLTSNEFLPTIKEMPSFKNNLKYIDILDYIPKENIEKIDGKIYIKDSKNYKIQNPLQEKIYLDENLSYFLGLYCAEGSTYKDNCLIITNSQKEIINKIINFYKSIDCYKNNKINKHSLRIYSKTLVRFIHSVTGVPLDFKGKGKSSYIKKVPEFIYSSDYKIISSFLRGVFDGDGTVGKNGVSLTSSSKKLVAGVANLLSILDIDYYLSNKNKKYFLINIPLKSVLKYKEIISFNSSKKIKKLNEIIKKYDLLKNHPSMKNNLVILDTLSKRIKEAYDSKLNKEVVSAYFCKKCNESLSKTSYYKKKLRFYCKKCNKSFYENEVIFKEILKYVNYDDKGKFIKGKTSWNKGILSGTISQEKILNIFKDLGLKKEYNLFNNNILWDKIKKIEKVNYSGMVYDFTVPSSENFNAGFGNIITHNTASFAGQQETYLNIKGPEDLLEACRKCFASLFTNRAIAYRVEKKFDHLKVALSIVVQKMVRSDLASSGVMFSIDTETGFKDVVVINGAYGLGENVVQGAVNPDEFMVFKPTLKLGKNAIISKRLGEKAIKMVYDNQGNKSVKNINVDINHRNQFCVEDKHVLTLAKWACIIEEYYSKKAGYYKPMDMEWAIDGRSKQLYIVQARPETVQANKNLNKIETYKILEKKEPIVTGISIGQKITTGKASIIKDVKDIKSFKKGDVLVTEMTDPDWVPIMKIASGIVTNKGGKTCFSGDTKILTDKGLLTFKEIYDKKLKDLKTPSLNKKTLKIEWKKITDVMKKKDKLISVSCTQTNKNTQNILKVTPNHKMINIKDGKIVDTEIKDMIKDKDCILTPEIIPQLNKIKKNSREAYILGAIFTDGHVHLDKRHGCVHFIQKSTKEKQSFINYFKESFKKVYNYDLKESVKKESSGLIRGKKVIGQANVYKCYIKEVCKKIISQREDLLKTILSADNEYIYNFLAGVIDGDGTYNNGRVNIYISKEDVFQAVIISLLRVGIVPQVTKNRTIRNVQVVEKLDVINKYTKRVNCKDLRKVGCSFFNTKQLFSNNFNSEINNRFNKNLLVDKKYLESILDKIKDNSLKSNIKKLIKSNLRQKRIILDKELGRGDVYNITVKDNHTYFVFTSNYTPIAVNNCHAAIIARELGIPCIVGTIDATLKIKDQKEITVDCSSGDYGFVYEGALKYKKETTDIKVIPKTKTKIMLNIGNPEQAFEQSFLPSDGVGLARKEFIIDSWIKIHPLALINYNKIKDKNVKHEIDKLTIGYKDKTEYFVDKLSQGIARIAAAFYPKKVILRMSDFKSDEYANLIGGKEYEPVESNPMIGWRGASRYYQGNYREGFALECKAVKKVREEMGLLNLEIMIPFCRTVQEGEKVLKELKKNGLEKGKNGLKVICMCEIPSNVILANEFLDVFDGFSIGSNDLTQLTLGLDRNSEIVASIYDERNPAIKKLIKEVVKIAKKKKKYIGICGQAPSDYPEFAEFLVSIGIDSMSLNPDTLIKTKILVSKKEKKR